MLKQGDKVRLTTVGVKSFHGTSLGGLVSTSTTGVVEMVDTRGGATILYVRFDECKYPRFSDACLGGPVEGWVMSAGEYELVAP